MPTPIDLCQGADLAQDHRARAHTPRYRPRHAAVLCQPERGWRISARSAMWCAAWTRPTTSTCAAAARCCRSAAATCTWSGRQEVKTLASADENLGIHP